MPIYAYRCAACGHAKDVLQKMSDAPLTVCPSCAAPRFEKQVTAAGFQLKGSGWYVTDFRDGNKGAKGGDKDAADKGTDKGDKVNKPAEGAPASADAKAEQGRKGKDAGAAPATAATGMAS